MLVEHSLAPSEGLLEVPVPLPLGCQALEAVHLKELELTKESHAAESEKQGGAIKRKNS